MTEVWVPDEARKVLRDLVRAREDTKEDQIQAQHRLSKFFLRHELAAPKGIKKWGSKHREWLDSLTWKNHAQQTVFQEYLHQLDEIDGRLKRLEAEIHLQATESEHAPVIQALQTMRGVAEVNAVMVVAEVGKFSRFRNPKQLICGISSRRAFKWCKSVERQNHENRKYPFTSCLRSSCLELSPQTGC